MEEGRFRRRGHKRKEKDGFDSEALFDIVAHSESHPQQRSAT